MAIDDKVQIAVLLTRDIDNGYVAVCPSMTQIVTHGDSWQETLRLHKQAIEEYLELLLNMGFVDFEFTVSTDPSVPSEEVDEISVYASQAF